jgi:hypothetical protein
MIKKKKVNIEIVGFKLYLRRIKDLIRRNI